MQNDDEAKDILFQIAAFNKLFSIWCFFKDLVDFIWNILVKSIYSEYNKKYQ